MAFYDLPKSERTKLVASIQEALQEDLHSNAQAAFLLYFSDEDTYIRKSAYESVGKIYLANPAGLYQIFQVLKELMQSENELVRQTVINAAGEIGKKDFKAIKGFMEIGLFDENHRVRNAVIGSIKKMGQKNPEPTLAFAAPYLKHEDKEVRREICHGIELRGRTHPEDILPLLKQLEFDPTARVRNTLVHVLGQIAYKKGCLEKVIADLKTWKNEEVVHKAIDEIIDVHRRYEKFSVYSQEEAEAYIHKHFFAG